MEVNPQRWNAPALMVSNTLPVANVTVVRLEHSLNASLLTILTNVGIVIEVSAVLANDEIPIVSNTLPTANVTVVTHRVQCH